MAVDTSLKYGVITGAGHHVILQEASEQPVAFIPRVAGETRRICDEEKDEQH
jgi:hypothetical protein